MTKRESNRESCLYAIEAMKIEISEKEIKRMIDDFVMDIFDRLGINDFDNDERVEGLIRAKEEHKRRIRKLLERLCTDV